MDINSNNNNSYYVNPNTRTLTTNKKNTAVSDRSIYDSIQKKLTPVDDMQKILTTPIKLASKTYVDRTANILNLAEGAKITVAGGFVLTVKKMGVEVSGGDIDNDRRRQEAMDMGGALATLLRNASGMMKNVATSPEGYDKWNSNVSKVLENFGIDTNRDFIVNGMRYMRDSNGRLISQANIEALVVYEKMKSEKMKFKYADEQTKMTIINMSKYYLKNVPSVVSDAWQKTIEKTGINPFPEGYTSILQRLSMEQDFITGGNDDIFGRTVESSIEGIEKILDRIDFYNESSSDVKYLDTERTFYSMLLDTIKEA